MAKGKAQGVRAGITGEKIKTRSTSKVNIKTTRPKKDPPSVIKQKVLVSTDWEETGKENACSLFLHLNATNGTVELSHEIPCQTITLKATRLHFKTVQDAQSYPAAGIVLSIFGPIQLNNNLTMSVIPILGDYSKVDVTNQTDIEMKMGKFLPRRFQYRVIDMTTNTLIPDASFDFAQIWFTYKVGVVN